MRRTAWLLLVLFVFSIPWEYSLDLGAPFGNAARILGLVTALIAVPAVLGEGRFRRLSPVHWLTLALYVWMSCTCLWTVAPHDSPAHLRGYAQEMILLWLVWEFAETASDLLALMRAWLAGSFLLALLTIAGFAFSDVSDQVRFAAIGQDPNDVSRFLVFGFPIAALLVGTSSNRVERALVLMYFPLGSAGVLLTASRSGLLATTIALAGCGIAALRRHRWTFAIAASSVILVTILIFFAAPKGTFERLGTTTELWQEGDLNQRVNIWSAGWRAFERSPVIGQGAGSFVTAAQLAPEDTAHNTALSILVEDGLFGLTLAVGILVLVIRAIGKTSGPLRFGLSLAILLWAFLSLTGTVWENRSTWLLFGIALASQRIAETDGELDVNAATGRLRLIPHTEEVG